MSDAEASTTSEVSGTEESTTTDSDATVATTDSSATTQATDAADPEASETSDAPEDMDASQSGTSEDVPEAASPPVGIPGGVPGAQPLSDETIRALTAVRSAESETGGIPFALSRGAEAWEVSAKLWDGAQTVVVSDDGTMVTSVTPATVDENVALLLESALVPLAEAAEVAVAEEPGAVTAVTAVDSDGLWAWQVSVLTSSGDVQVLVDATSGTVLDQAQ